MNPVTGVGRRDFPTGATAAQARTQRKRNHTAPGEQAEQPSAVATPTGIRRTP